MRLLKEILNFFLTYFLRPVVYRFFVIRWELFRKPPYYFNYYGYKVYYRQKDGLVYHIGSTGSFEKDVIDCCLKFTSQKAVFIDVGANIGLITLPLAKRIKRAVFHCFEPSPYPYEYFKKTLTENKLKKKIKLNKLGLYNKSGRLKFYIHEFKDASGDGIKDTFRAGRAKPIAVRVTTLDKYVKANNLKRLDLIKADVEGSELFVFKGAIKTIKKFKPVIIFEAWPKNLEAYNLNIKDIYNFFKSLKYSIYRLNGKKLDLKKFLWETTIQGNYLALPDSK